MTDKEYAEYRDRLERQRKECQQDSVCVGCGEPFEKYADDFNVYGPCCGGDAAARLGTGLQSHRAQAVFKA